VYSGYSCRGLPKYTTSVPTSPWRSAMTFPRQMLLIKEEGQYTIVSNPVDEIEQLRERKVTINQFVASQKKELTKEIPFGLATIEIIADFKLPQEGTTSEFGFELANTKGENIQIGYNCQTKKFLINRMNSGNSEFSKDFKGIHYSDEVLPGKIISMHLIVDVASVELFGQSGKIVMTDIFFPNEIFNNLSVYSKGGSVECKSFTVYKLNNIWNH
jgi:sucrose-6-phosphate hydrolase SacC (GH32 family)